MLTPFLEVLGYISKSAAMLIMATSLVHAHSDEHMDAMQAPHGGQLRMAGVYHFELVVPTDAKPDIDSIVKVYVTNHADKPIDTKGAKGNVAILADKIKTEFELVPDGENHLTGHGKFKSTSELKAMVSITIAGQKEESAGFMPLKSKKHH